MNLTRRFLSVTLSALGDTADDVAEFLFIGGWSGYRHSPTACPIAIYLKSVIPGVNEAAVSVNGISILTNDGENVHIATPPSPAAFIAAFDDGAYSDLAVTVTDHAGDVIDDLER